MNANRHAIWNNAFSLAIVLMALLGTAAATAAAEPAGRPVTQPQVAAQLYIWTQYYGERHSKLEDNLDDVFAATRRAGFDAVQGFLTVYDSPAAAARVAAQLKKHGLTMPAAYAGGAMHTRAAGQKTIEQVTRQAKLGASNGLRFVVHNPQPLGRAKTEEELAIQVENLNRLGAALGAMGVRLAIHNHEPEMRSGAREWYYVLRHTDPDKVGICLDLDWVLRGKQDPYRLLGCRPARARPPLAEFPPWRLVGGSGRWRHRLRACARNPESARLPGLVHGGTGIRSEDPPDPLA